MRSKMNRMTALFATFFALVLCAEVSGATLPLPTLSENEAPYFKKLVDGNNRFSLNLYRHASRVQSGNIFFSSYSIATGLGMASIGAQGETERQFRETFHYTTPLLLLVGDLDRFLKKGGVRQTENVGQLLQANALWIDKDIVPLNSYHQLLKQDYLTSLQVADFTHQLGQSVQLMNRWMAQNSGGKIRGGVSFQDVPLGSQMVLTTAASLKGQWLYPFDRTKTKKSPFYITPQRPWDVQMMKNTEHYLLWNGKQWDVLTVPFELEAEGTEFAMTILLPKEGFELVEVERGLTWENWEMWRKEAVSRFVELTLPAFHIDNRLDLDPLLKGIGLTKVFNSEANFRGLTQEKGFYLNSATHSASIELDEKGAGLRGVGLFSRKAPPKIKGGTAYPFTVNRPFIFIIWDQRTETILFIGRLAFP